MIKLSQALITTTTITSGGQSQTLTTDTLRISRIQIDFTASLIRAVIERGTINNGVFAPNYPEVDVEVDSDGSFRSDDGSWSGTLSVSTFLSSLASAFDNALTQAMPLVGSIA